VSDTNFDGELLVVLVVDPQCYMGRLTKNVTCACGQITFATHDPPAAGVRYYVGLELAERLWYTAW
jgi:hypothetical protein